MDRPFLVLDLGFDIVNSVGGLDLEGDSLAREGLYENLHLDDTLDRFVEDGRVEKTWD